MTTSGRWAGFITGLLITLSAHATTTTKPPPAEVFVRDPDILEAVLSPSGRRLAVTSARGVPRVGLAIYDLAPGGKLTRAAQIADADITQVRWVNENRLVFSTTDLSEGSGRPSGAPGLFAVNVDGSQFRQLIRRQGMPEVADGNRKNKLLDWYHTVLSVPPQRPDAANEEVLVAELPISEAGVSAPMWLNTRTGLTRSIALDTPNNARGWLTDSRGEVRVAYTMNKGRRIALWRAPGTDTWTPLYESGLIDAPFSIKAVDAQGTLYITRALGEGGHHALGRYDFNSRAPEAKPLVVTPGFDFAGNLVLDDAGNALGVHMLVDGHMSVWFDAGMKALQAEADRLFPGRVNMLSCRRCGSPDRVALLRSSTDRDPGRLYLYQAQPAEGAKNWTAIGPVRGDVDPAQMAGTELHRIKARDGRDLPVWVTKSDTATAASPAVVLVHGGPWVRGAWWGWHGEAQFLASRGYVVIEPEFRGSTGYGERHFRAGFKKWGQAMQDDVADALRWAQSQGLASDKACIAGASYGGYSTLMGLIKDPDLYRCGVAWVAVADLELLVKGSWWVNDDTSSTVRTYTVPEMIGDAEKDAAMLAANSPVRQAARIKAPLLLVYGEEDRRVPLAHGERLRKAMRESGNDPVWVTYPGEGHGFAILKNRVDFAQRMESFLARHLSPAAP